MSESTGDLVLDYFEDLTSRVIAAGYEYSLPIELALDDSLIRAMIQITREKLLRKGVEPPEFPLEVWDFFLGGPRPEIIG